MATVDVAPVTNALARAAQQRQDRFVAPRPGRRDEPLDQKRIESSRKPSGDAASKLSPPFAHGLIATGQSMRHALFIRRGHGIRVLAPRAFTAIIVLSDPEGEVRRQHAEAMIDGPRLTAFGGRWTVDP